MPAVRVRFQEEADIKAEVMKPTRLLGIMCNLDAAVVQAYAQVYNEWEAVFASYNLKQFIEVSNISPTFGQGATPSTATGSEEKHFASNQAVLSAISTLYQ